MLRDSKIHLFRFANGCTGRTTYKAAQLSLIPSLSPSLFPSQPHTAMSRHPTFADKPAHQHNESPGDALAPQQSATTDAEKASNRYADSETGVDFRHENAVAIRKLLLKLDVGIMPFAVLLYLGAYLDRGNM